MRFTVKEIEYFLYLYPISKRKCDEINEIQAYSDSNIDRKMRLNCEKEFYKIIKNYVDDWIYYLYPDELEVIKYRYFMRLGYEAIAIKLNYCNHSSVVKKVNRILMKLEKELSNKQLC